MAGLTVTPVAMGLAASVRAPTPSVHWLPLPTGSPARPLSPSKVLVWAARCAHRLDLIRTRSFDRRERSRSPELPLRWPRPHSGLVVLGSVARSRARVERSTSVQS